MGGGAAGAQHRRTGRAAVPDRRPANPFSFLFLAPVLISATALPARMTMALGFVAVACASSYSTTSRCRGIPTTPLVLPPIYLFGVWLSITLAIGVHQPLCVPGHRGSPKTFRRAGRHRIGAGARAASDPARRSRRRRRARTRHAAVDDLPDLARAGGDRAGRPVRLRHPICCASRRSAAATSWPRSRSCPSGGAPFDRMPLSLLIEEAVAPHRDFGVEIKVRLAVAAHARAGRCAQPGDPVRRRQHPRECRRLRARRRSR